MGVYNNNKDGTRSTLANTIQVVDAPIEQFVSRGEFNAVVPSDTSADNKLVNDDTVNDIWKVQGELGAKNLLVYPYGDMRNHYVAGNVDFQLDLENQGCFILNRTTDASTVTYTHRELFASNITPQFILPKGTYFVSDGIDDSDTNQTGQAYCAMMFRFFDTTQEVFVNERATASGNRRRTFIVTEEQEQAQRDGTLFMSVRVYCNPSKGVIENVKVKPMIRYASDTDDTWQPYAPTNYQLNQKVNMTAGVYLPNATNTGTKKVVASVGQTSVTFDANSFMTRYNVTASDLDLDISAETASGDVVSYNNVSVTGGIVTVTFDALAEQTTFICKCSVIQ
jgi:hypothetical protein